MSSKHTYEYDIDLSSDVAPARVIRMIKPGSRVLEIGAGPGSVTRHLARTLNCSVVALEVDPSALEILKTLVDRVHALDLNDPKWVDTIRDADGLFDFVIAADVLEHVYDPWKVLAGMKSLLKPGGGIVLSLPHVGHASVAACLIDEDFEYRPWGLLDRTHIRFFGVKNVQSLIEGAGLAIERAEFVVRSPQMTEFAHRWARIPPDVQAALERNRFAHVNQIVTLSRREDEAAARLDLMTMEPDPPTPETVRYWTDVMSYQGPMDGSDPRATTGAAGGGTGSVKVVAFYLPQFHPFPENDQWWGKGFTEWTNVTKAEPLFVGHYQPHLPADLGFYDLRLPEVWHEQVNLAKTAGIDAFCYHYYWFSGKRLMERALDHMLGDPTIDMPFCLCWANESWTRRWDGAEEDILIEQKYRPEDALEFIKSVEPYLRDPRYLTQEGKKILIVYRPQHLPDPKGWIRQWRDYAREAGLGELHLVCALIRNSWDYSHYGFDAGVEFPPHNVSPVDYRGMTSQLAFRTEFTGGCFDYKDIAEFYLNRRKGKETDVYRTVYPAWDNTARRKQRALVTMNGTPENYEYWLHRAITLTKAEFPDQDRFVFVNAWNEWAEGCHLEPDQRYGHGYLEATRRAVQGSALTGWTHVGVPAECGPAQQAAFVQAQPVSAPVALRRVKGKPQVLRKTVHGIRDALRWVRRRTGIA